MNKQIQIRGISRTPSDRMSVDGGCAESLNVHIEDSEVVPTLPPKQINEALGITGELGYKAVFIHKTGRGERTILEGPDRVSYTYDGAEEYLQIFQLGGESVVDYSCIGNFLIVTTDRHTHYAKWDEVADEYKYLGTRIPEPVIEFLDKAATPGDDIVTEKTAFELRRDPAMEMTWFTSDEKIEAFISHTISTVVNGIAAIFEDADDRRLTDAMLLDNTVWNNALSGISADSTEEIADYNLVRTIAETIWATIRVMIQDNRTKGWFSTPLFARWALKMYDGSYIYQSVPTLLGSCGVSYMEDRRAEVKFRSYNPGQIAAYNEAWRLWAMATLSLDKIHKVTARMLNSAQLRDWSDLIQSVDLFLSPDIYSPALNTKFKELVDVDVYENDSTGTQVITKALVLEDALPNEQETAVTAIGNFYRVASIPIDQLSQLENGYAINPVSQDLLLTLPTLQDDQLSHHEVIAAAGTKVYNSRVLNIGATVKLYPGPTTFPALYHQITNTDLVYWGSYHRLIFEVLDDDGNPHKVYSTLQHYGSFNGHDAYAWIAYPDTRCRKVQLVQYRNRGPHTYYYVYEYVMKEHPLLNLSYCFVGFGTSLFEATTTNLVDEDPVAGLTEDDAVYTDLRKLMLSQLNNPFLFPLKQRENVPADVIDVAATTRALSVSQLGQFNIYVFTKEGIYALPVTKEGTFAGSATGNTAISLDVAVGKVSPIDQAIIFVTERGVMMISASDITELSPNMNGKHYVLDADAAAVIQEKADGWEGLLPAMIDDTPFMAFMKGATVVYDYAGRRLICFNPEFGYQYIYTLIAGTWHKFYLPGMRFTNKINSYPSAYVAGELEGVGSAVLDFSTFLDAESDKQVRGVIVTRPIDFDADDVRKTVTALRHRGSFHRGTVKYILLGSMDGHSWGRLKSLRGGSYKLFRLVILTNLAPAERLSWLEANIETRFPNKLR